MAIFYAVLHLLLWDFQKKLWNSIVAQLRLLLMMMTTFRFDINPLLLALWMCFLFSSLFVIDFSDRALTITTDYYWITPHANYYRCNAFLMHSISSLLFFLSFSILIQTKKTTKMKRWQHYCHLQQANAPHAIHNQCNIHP